jgi:predicted ArsR family transcriptional regulator
MGASPLRGAPTFADMSAVYDAAAGERVAAAAAALRDLGADIELSRTSTGWRLQGHGCPLSAVTASQHDACAVVRAIVAGLIERPVSECCDRSLERPRCAFEVNAAS